MSRELRVQLVPERVADSVWIGVPLALAPAQTLIVTNGESPDALPAVPLKVGVVSFVLLPSGGLTRTTVGAVRSTVNSRTLLVPTLLELSTWVASAVYVPSASPVTFVVHVAPERVTGIVWTTGPPVPTPA